MVGTHSLGVAGVDTLEGSSSSLSTSFVWLLTWSLSLSSTSLRVLSHSVSYWLPLGFSFYCWACRATPQRHVDDTAVDDAVCAISALSFAVFSHLLLLFLYSENTYVRVHSFFCLFACVDCCTGELIGSDCRCRCRCRCGCSCLGCRPASPLLLFLVVCVCCSLTTSHFCPLPFFLAASLYLLFLYVSVVNCFWLSFVLWFVSLVHQYFVSAPLR